MSVKSFRKIIFADEQLNRFQENVASSIRELQNAPFLDGNLLTEVELTTGSVNEIQHKLGRELIGWMVVRQRGNSIIWDDQDTNNRSTLTLNLNASANVKIDLWVF